VCCPRKQSVACGKSHKTNRIKICEKIARLSLHDAAGSDLVCASKAERRRSKKLKTHTKMNTAHHNIEDYSDTRTGELLRESIARQVGEMTPEEIAANQKLAEREAAKGNWMFEGLV
jgi:hypothetical protein